MSCPGGEYDDPSMGFISIDELGACAAHAVEMGALVRDEPPIGQPKCKPWCGNPQAPHYGDEASVGARVGDVYLDFCTFACRDRAKAKADEQHAGVCARTSCRHSIASHPLQGCVRCACLVFVETYRPAEPVSAVDEAPVPPGFLVVGRSGPGTSHSEAGTWIRRARNASGGPAGGVPRQIRDRHDSCFGPLWGLGEYDILKPIAEPIAPDKETLSERMRNFNDGSRRFADEVAALEAKLAQAEKERDERGRQVEKMAEHVAKMRVERDEALAKLAKAERHCEEYKGYADREGAASVHALEVARLAQVQADARVAEAVVLERERCIAWYKSDVEWTVEVWMGMRDGAPAPTDKANRCGACEQPATECTCSPLATMKMDGRERR
jgi:hypothetical protein